MIETVQNPTRSSISAIYRDTVVKPKAVVDEALCFVRHAQYTLKTPIDTHRIEARGHDFPSFIPAPR
jgi:hypothetical protein